MILTHTCRDKAELKYGDELIALTREDPLIGEFTAGRLSYFASTTREPSAHMGRITTLIESGELFKTLGTEPFDPANDRVMICGSMNMLKDVKALVEKAGLKEGSNAEPADFVIERAFVG